MSVTNERRIAKVSRGAPFRSVGQRIIACIRCEHYRRTISSIPHRRLWDLGLVGCCIRPEGLCQEVGR